MSWPTKKLGEVIDVIESGKRPKGGATSAGVPSLGVEHITDQNKFRLENLKYIPEYFFKSLTKGKIRLGDILIAKDGATTGKTVYVSDNFPFAKAAVNEHLFILRGKELLINQKFLFYFLFSPIGQYQILKTKHGAAQGGIDQSFFNFVKIPLPPLEIQRQIIERLDVVGKAQELNDKQITLADELFQSLLDREIDPKGKSWEVKRLREVVIELVNGFPSRPVLKDAGVPQFRPHNIGLDGTLVFEGIKFVPRKIKNIGNYFLKKDNVIFNNTNSIELVGKTAYIDKDYEIVFSNHLTRIKVNPSKVSGYYLATLLHLLYKRRKFQTLCTPWVNQAAVNNTALRKLKFFLPPLQTQRQIVEKLQAVQDYKKKLLEQKQKLKELFNSCLNKAMKGEL